MTIEQMIALGFTNTDSITPDNLLAAGFEKSYRGESYSKDIVHAGWDSDGKLSVGVDADDSYCGCGFACTTMGQLAFLCHFATEV